ncbi:MAG: DUF6454 family protein [bacterium]
MTKKSRCAICFRIFIASLLFEFLLASGAFASQSCGVAAAGTIGPIPDDLFHVQGITFSTDSIFITSVDKNTTSGLLWKIDRRTFKTVKTRNLSENFMYHASGLQFDGKFLWVAIAVYAKETASKVLKIDPVTLKTIKKFPVADHIGIVATDGGGILYGGNWDAKIFYQWKEDGSLIEKRPNPTDHGYQDCKVWNVFLACSGNRAVDFIRLDTWQVARTFGLPVLPNGNDATREGMALIDGKFYFLPDDGAGTNIYVFEPDKKCSIETLR